MRVEEENELVLDARVVENLARELPIVVVDEKREFIPINEIRYVIVIGDIAGEEDSHVVINVMVGDECVGIGRELFSQFREEGVEEDAVPFAVGDVVKGVVFVALFGGEHA